MAVFLTGGHGHIGSWTAYLLAKAGKTVIIFDTNPEPPDCLGEVRDRITFIRGDVTDFPLLVETFRRYEGEIAGIIHTVAIMGGDVTTNPHQHVMLNIGGLLNLLEIARLFSIGRVVYTGTGGVYGDATGIPTEAGTPPNPVDLYGATKISGEYIGLQYGKSFGIDFRVCRLYWIYGPGRLPSQLPELDRAIFGVLEGIEGITLERGADQEFDFTHVEDAAAGVVLLYQAEALGHKVFNISTGVPHSVGEAAELSQKHTHFPASVAIGAGPLVLRAKALDIRRASEELGYQPRYSLEEGIKQYAQWIKMIKMSRQPE